MSDYTLYIKSIVGMFAIMNPIGVADKIILSGGVIAISLFVWGALTLAAPIGKILGTTGLNVATRIMGLLLSAIGIQMLASGLLKLLPGLA